MSGEKLIATVNSFRDSRALLDDEIAVFKEGGSLHPFVELVKNHDELQLCFRGNGNPKYVNIYYNNRQAFKIDLNGLVEISYRTARYWKRCREVYDKLVESGFSRCKSYIGKKEESFEEFLRKGDLALKNDASNIPDVDVLYENFVKPMLVNYAMNVDKQDYFKILENKYDLKSHMDLEKKAQQKLFKSFNKVKSGYFFYDLEYHQTEDKDKGSHPMEYKNEPDAMGVLFDYVGKPEKLVFVEVKSKEKALNDKNDNEWGSGLKGHIKKTKKFFDEEPDLIANRKREACDILNNYASLGLRGLDNSIKKYEYEDFDNIDLQALFIFTDEAMSVVNKNLNSSYSFLDGKEIDISDYYQQCCAYALDKDDLALICK